MDKPGISQNYLKVNWLSNVRTFREYLHESVFKGIWYHGTNNAFIDFDVRAERANRGSNIGGMYFTKREYEAESYGSRIIKAELKIKNPFYGQKKNKINEKMQSKTKELLLIYTRYKEDWVDTVILPDFVKRGNFHDLRDLNGDVKREILLSGGYDSYVDGDHVVVLSPNKSNVKIIE